MNTTLRIMVGLLVAVALAVTACEDTTFDEPTMVEESVDPQPEVEEAAIVITAAEFVDFTYTAQDIRMFCDSVVVLGYDLGYDTFAESAGDLSSTEEGLVLPTTREVFDEMFSRC